MTAELLRCPGGLVAEAGSGRLAVVRTGDRLRQLGGVVGPTVAAAVLGNVCIGKEAMTWFRDLRRPAMQVPLPAFGAVGAVYYLQLGTVLYRARRNEDARVRRLALLVLAGNEIWNVAFFGRRSPRNGFIGILVFLLPLLSLQRAVRPDAPSFVTLAPYTLWVIGYDVPWTFQLWQLNRAPSTAAAWRPSWSRPAGGHLLSGSRGRVRRPVMEL